MNEEQRAIVQVSAISALFGGTVAEVFPEHGMTIMPLAAIAFFVWVHIDHRRNNAAA